MKKQNNENEIFKPCEVCKTDISIYKGVKNEVVDVNDIKVWHYDCKTNDKNLPDDLAVKVFKCAGPVSKGEIVISYMTKNAVEHIDFIYANCHKVETLSTIIRTPLKELEDPKEYKDSKMSKEYKESKENTSPFDIFDKELSLWDKIDIWMYKIRQIPHKLKNRFITRPNVIRTSLNKYNYCDTVELLLYGNMDLFKKFYEEEIIDGIVDWSYDEPHKSVKAEMDAIYNWWKEYPVRLKEIDDMLTFWDKNREPWSTKKREDAPLTDLIMPPENDIAKKAFEDLHALENNLEKEKEEMLVRLVKIRPWLWT